MEGELAVDSWTSSNLASCLADSMANGSVQVSGDGDVAFAVGGWLKSKSTSASTPRNCEKSQPSNKSEKSMLNFAAIVGLRNHSIVSTITVQFLCSHLDEGNFTACAEDKKRSAVNSNYEIIFALQITCST